jgi:hypothetical protein
VPLERQKKSSCQIAEENPSQTAFGIPIPLKLKTELRSGFGIDKKNPRFRFRDPAALYHPVSRLVSQSALVKKVCRLQSCAR